jgi:toluene monooxygenase system protein E
VDVAHHRKAWEDEHAFQPLRELIERALVTYDWGEAFVVTNAVIKPAVDRVVNHELAGALAVANGDPVLRDVHFSLDEDAVWHREWTRALVHAAIQDTPGNAEVMSKWIDAWRTLATDAVEALATTAAHAPVALDAATLAARVTTAVAADEAALLQDGGTDGL